jgi:hypothetical protein
MFCRVKKRSKLMGDLPLRTSHLPWKADPDVASLPIEHRPMSDPGQRILAPYGQLLGDLRNSENNIASPKCVAAGTANNK